MLLITHDRVLADAWCGEIADIRELTARSQLPARDRAEGILCAMDSFALSERWNGWTDLHVMIEAARAAIAAGPLDPLDLRRHGRVGRRHIDARQPRRAAGDAAQRRGADAVWRSTSRTSSKARRACASSYNGRWLQIYGDGSDWTRAKAAYNAAQVEIALVAGITTFKLPTLPKDTVAEARKRSRGLED